MPFSFPNNPSVGQQSTQNGRTYQWSGYAWEIAASGVSLDASQITSGTFDAARLPLATTVAAGAVIVGTGLGVSSGTVSVTYGTTSGTACQGNDSRLSDTRTPTDGSVTTAKIASDAVTYAKLQNVSATDRLLGRSSAGAGDVEEITCTAFGRSLIDDADAAAARTTLSVQPTASPAFTGAATVTNDGNVVPLTVTNTGTANSFVVNDASGDTSPFVIDASGNVGVGTSSPAAALDVGSGNLRFSSTAQRITGDFSNSTISNRLMFQTSTSNGNTSVRCIPNGTATVSNFVAHNGSDSNNTSFIALQASLTETIVNSGATGTGTYLPLTFYTNNAPQVQISTSGQLLVTAGSGSSGSYKPGVAVSGDDDTGLQQVGGAGTISLVTQGSERVRVDASGNVGIGATPAALLDLGSTGGVKVFTYKSGGANAGVGTDLSGNAFEMSLFAGGTADTHGRISFGRRRVDTGTYTERMAIDASGTITAAQVYNDTVGATNRDLFVDNTGKFGYVSSIRASKTGITAIDDVSWLRDLTPVSFHYRKRNDDGTYSDEPDGTLDYGLIAEEVEPVSPEMCFYDVVDGEPQLRGVHYSKLITPMLRYIQQLEQRIAALEERINA